MTAWLLMLAVMACLSAFVLRTYAQCREPSKGWTKLILFGADFADRALPKVRRVHPHVYRQPNSRGGYDGQFYAQIAIDPSLRDPSLDVALDNPAYRARRIGLPALAFCLGLGQPRWILQAYALLNLLFWFVLAAALIPLLRPWTWQSLLCLAAVLLGVGVLASMRQALTDLPAAALLMTGLGASRGRAGALAAAALTRETSVLAAFACVDFRGPWRRATVLRKLTLPIIASAPVVVWFIYVNTRFGGVQDPSGIGNFGAPLVAMAAAFMENFHHVTREGLGELAKSSGALGWFYVDFHVHEMLTIAALTAQGVYLLVRRELSSPLWRTGVCYLALGCLLGPAVWADTAAAARVLLPMTICFHLLLARERPAWFCAFFLFGSVSIPHAVYEFWNLH